jgi:hypothetical protein
MSFRPCLLWSALTLSQLCLSQTEGTPPVPNLHLSGATSHIEIPFKLYRDYLIVVQGSLGGREALNFLIDTGVNPTVIDSRIAKKLGLTGGATVSWASSPNAMC